ncbi:TetR/AcrR family transcriptional regulator, partial [Nocardia salmonicida]
ILADYGASAARYTPGALVLLMSSISRFLRMEEAFDVDTGHADVVDLIESFLREVEGERRGRAR